MGDRLRSDETVMGPLEHLAVWRSKQSRDCLTTGLPAPGSRASLPAPATSSPAPDHKAPPTWEAGALSQKGVHSPLGSPVVAEVSVKKSWGDCSASRPLWPPASAVFPKLSSVALVTTALGPPQPRAL